MAIIDDFKCVQNWGPEGYQFKVSKDVEELDAPGGFQAELTQNNLNDMIDAVVMANGVSVDVVGRCIGQVSDEKFWKAELPWIGNAVRIRSTGLRFVADIQEKIIREDENCVRYFYTVPEIQLSFLGVASNYKKFKNQGFPWHVGQILTNNIPLPEEAHWMFDWGKGILRVTNLPLKPFGNGIPEFAIEFRNHMNDG